MSAEASGTISAVKANLDVWKTHATDFNVLNSPAQAELMETVKEYELAKTQFPFIQRSEYNAKVKAIERNYVEKIKEFSCWQPSFNTIRQGFTFKYSQDAPFVLKKDEGVYRPLLPFDLYPTIAMQFEEKDDSIQKICEKVKKKYSIKQGLFLKLGNENLQPAQPRRNRNQTTALVVATSTNNGNNQIDVRPTSGEFSDAVNDLARAGNANGGFHNCTINYHCQFNNNARGGSNANTGGGPNANAGGGSNANAGGGSNANAGSGSNSNDGDALATKDDIAKLNQRFDAHESTMKQEREAQTNHLVETIKKPHRKPSSHPTTNDMFHDSSEAVSFDTPHRTTTGIAASKTSDHKSPSRDLSKDKPVYLIKRMVFLKSNKGARKGSNQLSALETLEQLCSGDEGMGVLPTTKVVHTYDLKTELLSRLKAVLCEHYPERLYEVELPFIARGILVVTMDTLQDEREYDPRKDDDSFVYFEEINETSCALNETISIDEWSLNGCEAFGRSVNISVVMKFKSKTKDKITVHLRVASPEIGSALNPLTEIAYLIPDLVDSVGLDEVSFVSNKSDPASFPMFQIKKDALQELVKKQGLCLNVVNFLVEQSAQHYLNERCNAFLTFDGCLFAGEGSLLLSRPQIKLNVTIKGQHKAFFPSVTHIASAVENDFVATLYLNMTHEDYMLRGGQDEEDLRRLCYGLVKQGHRVIWGGDKKLRLGRFAAEADKSLEATVDMGSFNLAGEGTKRTREEKVMKWFEDAEKEMLPILTSTNQDGSGSETNPASALDASSPLEGGDPSSSSTTTTKLSSAENEVVSGGEGGSMTALLSTTEGSLDGSVPSTSSSPTTTTLSTTEIETSDGEDGLRADVFSTTEGLDGSEPTTSSPTTTLPTTKIETPGGEDGLTADLLSTTEGLLDGSKPTTSPPTTTLTSTGIETSGSEEGSTNDGSLEASLSIEDSNQNDEKENKPSNEDSCKFIVKDRHDGRLRRCKRKPMHGKSFCSAHSKLAGNN